MNVANFKTKNENEYGMMSFRRPSEPLSLAPQTGFMRSNSVNGDVPSLVNSSSNNSNPRNYGQREKGYIEKLLHSYGFVQSCTRKARLFFHFSEIKGDIESLKLGDIVEFQEACDPLTNKPVAISLVRTTNVGSTKKQGEIVSEKPVVGTVVAEPRPSRLMAGDGEVTGSLDGSVSYEQTGEMFFLAYSNEDVEGNQKIQVGDPVEFYISTDERNSNLRARKIRKAPSTDSTSTEVVYQGVVCSLKENFGFIERSDIVKEIFFHYSEFQGDIDTLNLGDDVEFGILTRNNKEVAIGVRLLPHGTVVFEDVNPNLTRGRITKVPKLSHGRRQSEVMTGRVTFDSDTGPVEIPFGDDAILDYTLNPGDLVEFQIVVDRRDKLQHAINIQIMNETFAANNEKREKGFITTLKEGFGFIRCTDREARMFFHFSEFIDQTQTPQTQDEVEFTVIQDPSNESRQIAVRICYLPKGTIPVENCQAEKYMGVVEKESGTLRNCGQDRNPGILVYDVNGTQQTMMFSNSAVDGNLPKLGDKVEFQVNECPKLKTRMAVNVRVVGRTNVNREYGYVVSIKDNFGFVETADHEKEIFFHFSSYEGNVKDFELGDEVEFTISQKGSKISAENLRRLGRGQLSNEDILPEILDGRILKPLGLAGSDQAEYSGLIQLLNKDGEALETTYPYGIMSLVDKRDLPIKGDPVRLQLAIPRDSRRKRAVRVAPVRRYLQARIETLSNESGTLNYDKDEGRLPFLLSDSFDASDFCVGDEVEFVVVQNLHGNRAAFNVRKTCEKPRPERLISRLRSVNEDQGQKVTVVRQPKGPDGTRGFKLPRSCSHGNIKNLLSV